ncbi:hypothetical protein [Clostridium sp.]|nr:hypothetical protein [Clostridium sp.]
MKETRSFIKNVYDGLFQLMVINFIKNDIDFYIMMRKYKYI